MEAMSVQIINPRAKMLLKNLEAMNLIQIKKQPSLATMLAKLRRNEDLLPSLEDITREVEIVRQARYERRMPNNY
ncbi:MAG: hypothetical protein LBI82_00860 [Dysgonamonadaceae bacterium]|jgi:hypothetical protein|nr:hypothetical protein [Dysgonamonadaceae bacterium]